jgi:glycosyltransferase involved in cell wall biosynthesis
MKVSIVTVCFNSAKTIRRALESIRQQTYSQIEVIIIDGASTDDTVKIASEYKDLLITIVSEKDKGIYDAMNKGVSLASGDVVYFLNSDDELIGASIIADAVSQFQLNGTLDMLYGDVVLRTPDSDHYRTHHHINKKNVLHTGICHQAIFARRSLFDKTNGFNLNFRIYADFDWIIRVFRANFSIKYFPRMVSVFHSGGASMADEKYNLQERLMVQHQYEKGLTLWLGHYRMRLKYHFFRWLGVYD